MLQKAYERKAVEAQKEQKRKAAYEALNVPQGDAKKYLGKEEYSEFVDSIPGAIDAYLTEGEVNKVRLDGKYLADALRACSGMVDLKLTDGKSPVLFQVDGYQLVTMPMLTNAENLKAEPAPAEKTEATKAVAEAEAITKAEKPKRKRKVKEPVAV